MSFERKAMVVPIETDHLFPILDEKLIKLLRSISPDDWGNQTRAKQWTIKDIASHLLDGNLKTLSILRDGYFGEQSPNIDAYHDLVNYINQLNADWVKATKRLSPPVLIDLLETTGKEYCNYVKTLKPFDDAIFSVAWAGEEKSKNWFHIAREYTEKWHHQQQIREAVTKGNNSEDGIMTPELYYPMITTFMQGLPHTYRNVIAKENTTLKVSVTSNLGGHWFLNRSNKRWALSTENCQEPQAEVILDPDTAWKLFTNGLLKSEAESLVMLKGDKEFGLPVLNMLSVMA